MSGMRGFGDGAEFVGDAWKGYDIRRLIRQGFGRRIIEKIGWREPVKASTYRDYEGRIEEYARKRQRPKHSV